MPYQRASSVTTAAASQPGHPGTPARALVLLRLALDVYFPAGCYLSEDGSRLSGIQRLATLEPIYPKDRERADERCTACWHWALSCNFCYSGPVVLRALAGVWLLRRMAGRGNDLNVGALRDRVKEQPARAASQR